MIGGTNKKGGNIMNFATIRWIGSMLLFTATFNTWAQLSTKDIARSNLPAVVHIEVFNERGEKKSTGSGFIVSANGLITTNYHVVEGADTAKVFLQSGEGFSVEGIVEMDDKRDFALIRIPAVNLPVVSLGNSDNVGIGEKVIAIGSPVGLSGSVTEGILSQIRLRDEYKMMQHDAAISPGSSGGPLFNEAGEVIGVNTSQRIDGQNLNFALPINYIRGVLEGDLKVQATLRELTDHFKKIKSEDQERKIVQLLDEYFMLHQDPQGMFTVMLPRDWSIQRSESYDEKLGFTTIQVNSVSRNAELADFNGWLSEGIRFTFLVPRKGVWSQEDLKENLKSDVKEILAGYDRQQSSEITQVNFGNVPLLNITGVGEFKKLSKLEAFAIYRYYSPQLIIRIDVSMPMDQQELFEFVNKMLQNTFKTNLIGQ